MTDNGHISADIIETTDEHGQVHLFEKVDEYEIDNQRYALLVYQGAGEDEDESELDTNPESAETEEHAHGCGNPSCDEDHDNGYDEEIVVMRIITDGADEVFEAIEDEDEFQRVVKHIEEAGFSDDTEIAFDLMTESVN